MTKRTEEVGESCKIICYFSQQFPLSSKQSQTPAAGLHFRMGSAVKCLKLTFAFKVVFFQSRFTFNHSMLN